jgi:hypothetical protein
LRGFECQAHNFPDMHIRLSCFISSIIFLLLSPQLCRSQTPPNTESTPQARLLEGCYEVKLGRWWPWGFGEEGAYVKPPNRIQLLAQLGTRGFETGRPLIRAIPRQEEQPSRESSFWSVNSQNQVTLSWTDGFVGVRLELAKHGDELGGWAHPHFDAVKLIPRIAHATARRITCPSQ